MLRITMMSAAASTTSRSVDMIDALRELLANGEHDAVITLVSKLIATHREQLREMLQAAKRRSSGRSEGVNAAQLDYLLEELKKAAVQEQPAANAALQKAAGVE